MRPVRLRFQAFGSFPGLEHIDFTVLEARGLFVVSGPTGSGKTTIFDAMTYALFGQLPGDRPDREARSHHADSETATFVEFEFEVGDDIFIVRRSPAYERPKLRGSGTATEKPTASLVQVLNDNSQRPLAARSTDCNARCIELVGLTADQFQRVILLPQGKFSSFLLARSSEREPLLRHLFGGELYQLATKYLGDRVKALHGEVGHVDEQIRRHLHNARAELATVTAAWLPELTVVQDAPEAEIREVLDQMRRQVPRHQRALDHVVAEASVAANALTRVTDLLNHWLRRHQLLEELAQRVALTDQFTSAAQRLEHARRAAPVVQAAQRHAAAAAEAQRSASVMAEAQHQIRAALGELGVDRADTSVAELSTICASRGHRLDLQRQHLHAAAQAAGALEHAVRHHHEVMGRVAAAHEASSAAQSAREVHAQRRQLLAPIAATVDRCRSDRQVAAETLSRRQRLDAAVSRAELMIADRDSAHEKYLQVMQRYIATQAPRLAAQLQPDEPCPVCGSVEHPAPALIDPADHVDHDAVDVARLAHQELASSVTGLQQVITDLGNELGADADLPVLLLEQRVAEADLRVQAATTAFDELRALDPQIEELTKADEAHRTAAEAADRELAVAVDRCAAAKQQHDQLAIGAQGIDADELVEQQRLLDVLVSASAQLPELEASSLKAATTAADLELVLSQELAQSGFEHLSGAQAAAMPSEECQRLADRVEQWRAEVADRRAKLQVFESMELPDQQPDPTAAQQRNDEAAALCEAERTSLMGHQGALDRCEHALQLAAQIAQGSAELRENYAVARRVFATCNGESASKISLDTWILAGQLERVTEAANVHLARMTAHRYQLHRAHTSGRGRAGLDIEVLDAHTGRARPTTTLSGGEQFQASLALALGLADVVSHGGSASGHSFGALFVDEGFGSLDPEALDQAIAALGQLQASGRMVGAITHVEAMKHQLPVGIEVRRLPDAGGSTLRVH